MSVAVKVTSQVGSGWLVFPDQGPNEFLDESMSMNERNLFNLFGARVIVSLRVSRNEWRRLRALCGVRG